MNEDGIVSLWIGSAVSRDAFDDALAVKFSDDGDFLGSRFSRAFGIGYYDEGLIEADYHDVPAKSLEELLKGVSYADVVVPRFLRANPDAIMANSFVLLYNFRHAGPQTWNSHGLSLRHIGAVEYR